VSTKPQSAGSKEPHVILGIHVIDHTQHASDVQAALTEFGTHIKTRLGLHDVHDGFASPNGLMLIEFVGGESQSKSLIGRLAAIKGVEVKQMVFEHP
jgi:hypothetical protein